LILVDTSIWVSALRSATSREAVALRVLLDADEVALAAPVRVELLIGAPVRYRSELRRILSALPYWIPAESTWRLIESWLEPAARAGERFGMGDLLVAAVAAEHAAPVWSLDRDFERMARLRLVRLHSP
jgi:predicted nucleic acid-binding protein